MKIRLKMLGIAMIPVGAFLVTACAPINNEELVLEENTDKIGVGWLTEFGRCNDGWDNDGNGMVDAADPQCHMSVGPLRDLSLFDFPQGHNFFPDINMTFPGGPGYAGDFRDPELMSRWLRFLTNMDGTVAGYDIFSPEVNPFLVPIPAPVPVKIFQGTAAAGNNNNLDIVGLHEFYLNHDFLSLGVAPAPVGIGGVVAPIGVDAGVGIGVDAGVGAVGSASQAYGVNGAAGYDARLGVKGNNGKDASGRYMPQNNRNGMNMTNGLQGTDKANYGAANKWSHSYGLNKSQQPSNQQSYGQANSASSYGKPSYGQTYGQK